ncbi:hypothetical protein ACH4UT_32810 [Streptomyces sp. NPDC020799]|uniref:hypothetical protein n=1 Tax=Streptomyces sp. NPDC020799 TaxID=3365091 RepID=UPI00378DA134
MTTAAIPVRTFLPLADSPLLDGRTDGQDADLAVRLAEQADPEPATIRSLLTVTHPATAARITNALEMRDDLPLAVLALLVAHRPESRKATARLRALLFPAACHTFAHTVAALAHRPETISAPDLVTEKFAAAAAAADPEALHTVLADLLTVPALAGPADAVLGRLLDARAAAQVPPAAVDRDGAAARERTRRTRISAEITARRCDTITAIAQHTGGLTHAAELWYDALTHAADTPETADRALALAVLAPQALATGTDLDCPWPAVTTRWQQVTAIARAARRAPQVWPTAWVKAATTEDGSAWDPTQRALVAGYDLLTDHVRALDTTDTVPSPDQCWATDPAGRTLLHTVADQLTGHLGHSPLPHFDDALLIRFVQGLAKNRRDRLPGTLQIHGLIAALKAARSKHRLLARAASPDLGIVVPTRGDAHRIAPPSPDNPGGQDALAVKIAQLAWLLEARPDARAHLLLIDEDPAGASAHAAQRVAVRHPQVRVTAATRPDQASAKGGAVLWGLGQLHAAGHTVLAYTDVDLTYPLDQLGLHLAALGRPGIGAVIGSRRLPDSHGYYPPSGPTPASRLYQQAVTELLGLKVGDPQAGFKAFHADALADALPRVADHGLSFDTELLAAVQQAGYTVTEAGVAALHRWVEGRHGAPRDYDAMLQNVHQQAQRLGTTPRSSPLWDRIQAVGSLAAAATKPAPVEVMIAPVPR